MYRCQGDPMTLPPHSRLAGLCLAEVLSMKSFVYIKSLFSSPNSMFPFLSLSSSIRHFLQNQAFIFAVSRKLKFRFTKQTKYIKTHTSLIGPSCLWLIWLRLVCFQRNENEVDTQQEGVVMGRDIQLILLPTELIRIGRCLRRPVPGAIIHIVEEGTGTIHRRRRHQEGDAV